MIYLSKNNEAIEQMLSHLEADITPIEQKKKIKAIEIPQDIDIIII